MKKIINVILFSAIIIFVFNAYGAMAPDFTLKDTYGKTHRLSDFSGKYVILEWTNPDCPFTLKHYNTGNMQALQKKYTDKGVVWLSISSSAPGNQGYYKPAEYNEIIKKRGANPTYFLLDHEGIAGRTYGAKTTPHIFIVDPKGEIIYSGAIDNISSANPEDIAKADNYIDMVFEEIEAGKKISHSTTIPYGCSAKY